MKLAVISFTKAGSLLCMDLVGKLRQMGEDCDGYVQQRFLSEIRTCGCACDPQAVYIHGLDRPVADWARDQFSQVDGLVFIGAAGIAVRAVGPCLRDKWTDPAVVVIDELERYVISLLSGHIGGANDLTRRLAGLLGARPVITTASDVNGKTAIDVWAVEHGLKIGSRVMAREVAAALLENQPVGFFCDEPVEIPVLPGCRKDTVCGRNVRITVRKHPKPENGELPLIPQILIVGIGCKKGTPREQIENCLVQVFDTFGLYREAVAGFATIDLKKDENGLLELASAWNMELQAFPSRELAKVAGVFDESEFVRQVTGVGNVCERAACLAAGRGAELLVPKQAGNGVTIAVARRNMKMLRQNMKMSQQ